MAESGPVLRAFRRFGGLLGRLSRASGPVLTIAWYGLIFSLSAQPSARRPGPISGSWALNTGHSLIFGLLALWMIVSLPRSRGWPLLRRSSVASVLGLVLVLGTLDELHQGGVPGRYMSATDVITDLTGAACVLWICAYTASERAIERGLRQRLALCIVACCTAGAFATLVDHYLG
ncbi:MAG: VanZ family protein [Planctomycetota bacterium]